MLLFRWKEPALVTPRLSGSVLLLTDSLADSLADWKRLLKDESTVKWDVFTRRLTSIPVLRRLPFTSLTVILPDVFVQLLRNSDGVTVGWQLKWELKGGLLFSVLLIWSLITCLTRWLPLLCCCLQPLPLCWDTEDNLAFKPIRALCSADEETTVLRLGSKEVMEFEDVMWGNGEK